MTILNGCDARSFDKRSRRCRKCMNRDYCAERKAKPFSYDRPSPGIGMVSLQRAIDNYIAFGKAMQAFSEVEK